MDIYKLKFTKLQNEIFRLLGIHAGETMNQRQIAQELNVSPTAIAKALPLLEKELLIIIKKDKNGNYVQLNRDAEPAISLKRVENLKLIYESGLKKQLEEAFPGATVILFGSYSRGDDTLQSDIDIAVIGRKEKHIDISKYEKMLERKIVLNFYPALKDIHKNLRENILNGIILTGSVSL